MFVCTAENDLLRGRALYYVESVKKSGWNGQIELVDVQGEGHCFQIYDLDTSPGKAKELISRIVQFIMQC
ncbi:hypothetical protein Leryth_020568 [Lithospermum erythrorhizon]|nr:hypothetical protein Leryth_020568 [Lithospermum erythrorhizon]